MNWGAHSAGVLSHRRTRDDLRAQVFRMWPVGLGLLIALFGAAIGMSTGIARLHSNWSSTYTYSHGYLVLGMSAWLLAVSLHRRPLPALAPSLAGGVMLVSLTGAYAVAEALDIAIGTQALLPLILLSLIASVAGAALARRAAIPVGFIYFAVPLWNLLSERLQDLTTLVVTALLPSTGIAAYIEGYLVTTPAGSFEIAAGCSGLNFFVVALALAAFYGLVWYRAWHIRLALLVVAASVALMTNWVRVFTLIVVGERSNMQHYLIAEEHYLFGWILFAVLMAPVLWLARWLEGQDQQQDPDQDRHDLDRDLDQDRHDLDRDLDQDRHDPGGRPPRRTGHQTYRNRRALAAGRSRSRSRDSHGPAVPPDSDSHGCTTRTADSDRYGLAARTGGADSHGLAMRVIALLQQGPWSQARLADDCPQLDAPRERPYSGSGIDGNNDCPSLDRDSDCPRLDLDRNHDCPGLGRPDRGRDGDCPGSEAEGDCPGLRRRAAGFVVGGICAGLVLVAPAWLRSGPEAAVEPVTYASIAPDTGGWVASRPDERWAPDYQRPHATLREAFVSGGGPQVDVFLARYLRQQPDAKLIYYRNSLDAGWYQQASAARVVEADADADSRPVRELVLGAAGERRLVWYWYQVAGMPATDRNRAKLLELAALLRGRRDGAVVALSTPCSLDCAAARDRLLEFLAANGSRLTEIANGARDLERTPTVTVH